MQGITFQDIKKRLILVDESANGYNSMREYIRSINSYINNFNKRPEDILNKIKEGCEASFLPSIDCFLELYNSLYNNPKSSTGHLQKAYRMISETAIPKYSKDILKSIYLYRGTSYGTNLHASNMGVPSKDNTYIAGFRSMYEQAVLNESCYRIINNYNKLSKRFNIDNLIRENTVYNGVYDSIVELCKLIDTYKIPLKVKVNAALESSYFGLSSAHYDFDKKDVVQAIVDYFGSTKGGLKTCADLLEDSKIYEPEDIPPEVDIIHEEEPEEENTDVGMEIESYISKNKPVKESIEIKPARNFNNIFSSWKVVHEENKFDSMNELISDLFSGDVNDAVENSNNLLVFIKTMIVLDPVHAQNYINAVHRIGEYFTKNYIDKLEVNSMIKKFSEIISVLNIKISNLNDKEEKNNLMGYRDACEEVLSNIKTHYNDIENDDSAASEYDEDFQENVNTLLTLCELMPKFNVVKERSIFPYVENSFFKSIGSDNALLIAEFVHRFPDCYNKEEVLSLYESYYKTLPSVSYKDKTNIKDAISLLKSESYNLEDINNIYEICETFSTMIDGMNCIQDMVYNQQLDTPLTEASFLNNLKTISYNLKKKMKDLSHKEQTMARKFDMYMNLFAKKARDAMMNDNRESIIKGSVIPSASKCVKLVLTGLVGAGLASTGIVAAQVAGAIAIIRVLAYFVCSKRMEAAQRQEIIDEIEIELKMCDKYIDEAEAKNDKEALRQLYKIQRTLHRQNQRCKHHMRIAGQTVHDIPHAEEY